MEPIVDEAPPVPRGGPAVNRLRYLIDPVPRAALYGVRSWRRAIFDRRGDGVPHAGATPAMVGHALLDEALLAGFRVTAASRPPADLARIEEEGEAAVGLYEGLGWLDRPAGAWDALATPAPLEQPHLRWGRAGSLRYERLSFESAYQPHPLDPGRERWLGYEANQRAKAWVLRHPDGRPRPWLVVVHGRAMGRPSLDLTLLKARWLHDVLGLDVVMPLLPLHGRRRQGVARTVAFPSEDLLDNVHATFQAVSDVRRVIGWVRAQAEEVVPVGITGVSLGGFVSTLVASVEDGLAAAVLGVPVVELPALMAHHTPRVEDPALDRRQELARRLGPLTSPLALEPRVPWEGRAVYAGLADRLVHPRHHVGPLWEHWDRPRALWYQGGHAAFSRSKAVGPFVVEALTAAGLVAPPTS